MFCLNCIFAILLMSLCLLQALRTCTQRGTSWTIRSGKKKRRRSDCIMISKSSLKSSAESTRASHKGLQPELRLTEQLPKRRLRTQRWVYAWCLAFPAAFHLFVYGAFSFTDVFLVCIILIIQHLMITNLYLFLGLRFGFFCLFFSLAPCSLQLFSFVWVCKFA